MASSLASGREAMGPTPVVPVMPAAMLIHFGVL